MNCEQIMSKHKVPSTFLCQMEAIVLSTLQILFAMCAVLKIGKYHLDIPQYQLEHIFSHVTCLDQSCASINILFILFILDYNL